MRLRNRIRKSQQICVHINIIMLEISETKDKRKNVFENNKINASEKYVIGKPKFLVGCELEPKWWKLLYSLLIEIISIRNE